MHCAKGHVKHLRAFRASLDKRLRFVFLQRNSMICIEGIFIVEVNRFSGHPHQGRFKTQCALQVKYSYRL